MKLRSLAFAEGSAIPALYTCDGDDISPPLAIQDVPPDAKSLALIVVDPDAPGGDFVHWMLWNIDPLIKEIPEGAVPVDVQHGQNDFGRLGWGGPCPPVGTHRYEFHLYALSEAIDLPSPATKQDLRARIQGIILEEATTTGIYARTAG